VTGKLIVLEGTDGVGRSTQTRMLRNWLESSGLGVYDTGLTRGELAGRHIQEAKEGHTLGRLTQCLFYATDFADRLEMEIMPALRAGYVVLTDRYIYSLLARGAVRGVDRTWLRKLYGFAVIPDLIIYLKVSLPNLLPRALEGGGFDFWESGMDYLRKEDLCEAFVTHQSAMLEEFDRLAGEYGFVEVDANRGIEAGFTEVQGHVKQIVEGMKPPHAPFAQIVRPEIPMEERHESRRSVGDRLRELLVALFDESDA